MHRFLKRPFIWVPISIFGALVIANIVIFAGSSLGGFIYAPDDLDFNDPIVLEAYIATIPWPGYMIIEVSYIMASFVAALFLGRMLISNVSYQGLGICPTIFVGLVLTALNMFNIVQIPHPTWFAILTTITFIPMVLWGRSHAYRKWG